MNLRRNNRGYSLVESLVVIAIILVMLAIALPSYVKALRQAKDTAADEALRQRYLANEGGTFLDNFTPFACDAVAGDIADNALYLRTCARAAYRQAIDAGKFDVFITELLYRVENQAEFEAYWWTLIAPEESVPITFTPDASLIAYNPEGDSFILNPIERAIIAGTDDVYLVGWEFVSTNMGNMNSDSRLITAIYSNGQREKVRYPSVIPATPLVATLSQRFMDEVYAGD